MLAWIPCRLGGVECNEYMGRWEQLWDGVVEYDIVGAVLGVKKSFGSQHSCAVDDPPIEDT